MRPFLLVRAEDETGNSGTGVVAEGIEYIDGTCAMRWCVPADKPDALAAGITTTTIYSKIDDVLALHGHDGRTQIEYVEVRYANGHGRGIMRPETGQYILADNTRGRVVPA